MADGALTPTPVLPALPWLLFAHHVTASEHARIRTSPALTRLWDALDVALADYDRTHESTAMLETWESALRDVVRATATPPRVPYATAWVLAHATLEALRECDPAHRSLVAPVVAALGDLVAELGYELAGHARWDVSVNAVVRYRELFAPHADDAEVVATVARLAGRAVRLGAIHGGDGVAYVSPEDPRAALVVAGRVVVTVVPRRADAKVLRAIKSGMTKGGVR